MSVRETKLPDTMVDLEIDDKLKKVENKAIDDDKVIKKEEKEGEKCCDSVFEKIRNVFSLKK